MSSSKESQLCIKILNGISININVSLCVLAAVEGQHLGHQVLPAVRVILILRCRVLVRVILQRLTAVVFNGCDTPGILEQNLPLGRDRQGLLGPLKDFNAELLLQLPDMVAHGRLGQIQAPPPW